MAVPGATLSTITTVVSQEPALGQCRNIVRETGLEAAAVGRYGRAPRAMSPR